MSVQTRRDLAGDVALGRRTMAFLHRPARDQENDMLQLLQDCDGSAANCERLEARLIVAVNGYNIGSQISADELHAAAARRGGALICFDESGGTVQSH